MAKIPSKQLIRAGDRSSLQEKLINRELGFCTADRRLYVKYEDILIPAGSTDIPAPVETSVFMGKSDGTMGWATFVKAESPYDENTELWYSLDGTSFAADFAYKDSEGHLIGSNAYFSPRVRPVYGPFKITNEEVSHFLAVRIGDSDTILGGLIPADPPVEDNSFRKGDMLFVESLAGTPYVRWIHPESTPVKDSVKPVTSGAVYNVRFLIDPNLYDPNEDEDLTITGDSASSYRVGYYYIVGDTLYRCESHTSSSAVLTRIDGVVTALNELAGKLQAVKVAIYDFESDTNVCRDVGGNIVSGATILNALAGGSVPILIIRSTRGGTVTDVANITNGGTTVEFQTIPDEYGRFEKYSISYAGNTWTVTDKTIVKDTFVATYGVTTATELSAALQANKTIVLPSVVIGDPGNTYTTDMVLSAYRTYHSVPPYSIYQFASPILSNEGKFAYATLNTLTGEWAKGEKTYGKASLNSVSSGNCPFVKWGDGTAEGSGTYKSLLTVSVSAGQVLDITLDGSLQFHHDSTSAGGWAGVIIKLSEQASATSASIAEKPVYVRSFINGSINEATVSVRFVVPAQTTTKTYYIGAYNLYGMSSAQRLLLASNITTESGVSYSKIVWDKS